MIIQHNAPNSRLKETDTGKLSDVPADLLESAEVLREKASKYKRQFFIVMNPEDSPQGKLVAFWNFRSERLGTESEISLAEEHALFGMLAQSIDAISKGKYSLVKNG